MLTLKKKSKSQTSWVSFYYIMSTILSFAGLNYFSDTFCDARWKKVLAWALLLFHISNCVICFSSILVPNNYDLEDKASIIIVLCSLFCIGLKAVTLLYYRGTLKELSDVILHETSRDDLEPWELELAEKYYRLSKFICVKITFVYTLVPTSFILAPLLSEKDYAMPFLMEFPGTNASGQPGFEINYFLGSYTAMYGTAVELGFDIPVFLQALFIALQFDRCIHYCNMIGDLETPYNTQDKQSKLLKQCIKLHANIFEFFTQVSTILTSAVAVIMTTTVPLMTILMFTTLLGNVHAAPFFILSLTYYLFMYCSLGEIVSTKCEETSLAIYTSQWYRLEKAGDRRTFLFFLAVSQRAMRFSAGGIYALSLETFTELMKQAYGACAFLKEITERG